ncbi:MAG TPA: DUF1295 domain-containing protein [Polyangiaceae bacterium]|nr:DUF1295 domain-containing protein [Polyangiaceae bacterium]
MRFNGRCGLPRYSRVSSAAVPESTLHLYLTLTEIGVAIPTLVALLWISAPYGRHARDGWGPTIGNRTGWIVMELPASLLFLLIFFLGAHSLEVVPLILLTAWQLHYIHRTFIFPFRLRGPGKRMPLSIPLMAIVFNSLNAYISARWISHLGYYDVSWLTDPRFVIGALVFLTGLAINLHADTVLINLRKPGEKGYKIPRGGLYRYVTCPNYLGEIIEWTGWAIMTWSLPGLAFAIYTAANVGPRALTNHRWYLEKFGDQYPKARRALIPFLL